MLILKIIMILINKNYETPLHIAAKINSKDFAEFLIQNGANINSTTDITFMN